MYMYTIDKRLELEKEKKKRSKAAKTGWMTSNGGDGGGDFGPSKCLFYESCIRL